MRRLHRRRRRWQRKCSAFHVIAESNSVKDQRIKLHVRDTVLSYMKSQMPETERKSAQLTKDWVKKHQKELVKTADEVLKKEGVSYRAQAKVTSCYFPDKRYGDIIFPEGEYEALRITLGSGKGHNWLVRAVPEPVLYQCDLCGG